MAGRSNCETCGNFVYDDELETYCCDVNLDEDEMSAFLRGAEFSCPFYRLGDEYAIVRKQM